MRSCLFCEEGSVGYNTFFENELFRARWDGIPAQVGHAEILPKRHVQFFHELTANEKEKLLLFVDQVIARIQKADMVYEYERLLEGAHDVTRPYIEKALICARDSLAPTAFNHGINDGPIAGQTIPHFHYHIIPRRDGDVDDPRGGIRRMFEEDAYAGASKGPTAR